MSTPIQCNDPDQEPELNAREQRILDHLRTDLGFDATSFVKLGVQAYNAHYKFVTRDGAVYHLVDYNLPPDLPLMGIKFEHAILRHLQEHGFDKIPKLYVHDDETLFRIDDTFYCITEFIDHCVPVPADELTPTMIEDMARALDELLGTLTTLDLKLDYFPEHIFVYPALAFRDAFPTLIDGLGERVQRDTDAFDAAAREQTAAFIPLAKRFMAEFDWDCYQRIRTADPTTIVHGDYRPMNIVFDPDTGAVDKILDFNCSFNDIRLWDICYTALTLEGKETIGCVDCFDRVTAFLRAMHRVHPLTDDEQTLLPQFLTFIVLKLMTAAMESWWITDRFALFQRLLDEADQLAHKALRD